MVGGPEKRPLRAGSEAFSSGVEVRLDRWPLVFVRLLPVISDEDFETFLRDWQDSVLGRAERYATVLDARGGASLTAKQRRRLTAHIERNEGVTSELCAASAFVIDSTLTRSVLNAVLWLRKPPYPVRAFTEYSDALLWAEASLALSDHTRDLRAG